MNVNEQEKNPAANDIFKANNGNIRQGVKSFQS